MGKTIALGKVSGAEHRDWPQQIQRRNALQEIARRAIALQSMIDNPIGWPGTFEENPSDPIAAQADQE